jgi:hypothetical protein
LQGDRLGRVDQDELVSELAGGTAHG